MTTVYTNINNIATPQGIDMNLLNMSWNDAAKSNEERLHTIQNMFNSLKRDEDMFVSQEKGYLENSIQFLESFSNGINDFIKQEESNIRKIKEEMNRYLPEQNRNNQVLARMKDNIFVSQKQIQAALDHQRELSNKKKDIVEQINPKELKKIKFVDYLDESNDIFKWCLQVIYREPKTNYKWSNFKKQAFVKDKGADFLLRLKGLNLHKLAKQDYQFSRNVVNNKLAYLADLEYKGVQNNSLRHLFDYIELVAQYGDCQDAFENDKLALEDGHSELEKKLVEFQKVNNIIEMFENKIKDIQHYIDVLNKLKPLFTNHLDAAHKRLASQIRYQENLKNENIAVKSPVQSQTLEIYQKIREEREASEEDNFEGEQTFADSHKKVETRSVLMTDLKETEFGSSRRVNCESCSMF